MRSKREEGSQRIWPSGIAISDVPVRRVHTRARHRNTSLIYSTLTLGMRVSESASETRFLKVAQLDPGVECIRAQPTWLRVLEDGRMRRRAPDFAVIYSGRAELHEVKQDRECWKPDVRSELLSIRDEVERHPGWRYSVALESALVAEPLRSNTDLLWRALRPENELDEELTLRTGEILDEGPVRAHELIENTSSFGGRPNASASWENLLAMIAAKMLQFDVIKPLTLDSLIWNGRSGPPRRRTLPFCTVDRAISERIGSARAAPFCAITLRGVSP